jgi:hypothetical protein
MKQERRITGKVIEQEQQVPPGESIDRTGNANNGT